MPTRTRLLSYLLFVLGVALLTGVVLYYFHTNQAGDRVVATEVPGELAALPLSQVITGEEAIDSIHRLHGSDFPLEGGAVAVYGKQNLVLWVSDAGGEAEAAGLTELMRERIAEGRSPFIERGHFEVEGFMAYALEGLGQDHFYWRSADLVLWLSADRELGEQALIETVDFYR